jgi:hypothetical protein
VVTRLTALLGRPEFNEATEQPLREAAVAAARHDGLRAICAEFLLTLVPG